MCNILQVDTSSHNTVSFLSAARVLLTPSPYSVIVFNLLTYLLTVFYTFTSSFGVAVVVQPAASNCLHNGPAPNCLADNDVANSVSTLSVNYRYVKEGDAFPKLRMGMIRPINNQQAQLSQRGRARCSVSSNILLTYSRSLESQLHRIQKTTENIHVSDGLRRIVTFLIISPYKYSYLLTSLLT